MSKRKSIPAVGYARRSTDMQERSIPDQKAYIEKWASENGCKIIRWFIDDALSGTSTRGRDAFADMIDAAENGRDFDVIVCYDIARFSRGGTNETGYYLHRLRMVGVRAVFAADGIPEGDEGELIQGVKSWQARQYSLKLAKDTIRGQISNIRERKSAPGGIAPYGYDKQVVASDGTVLRTLRWMPDGSKQEYDAAGKLLRVIPKGQHIKKAKSDVIRYVPSTPDRVETMRRMFKLCVKGYGFHYIAQLLNKEGVPSPAGQAWNASRIGKLLRNPCYKGAIAWNRHSMGSLFGLDSQGTLRPRTKKDWRKNPTADWIISEGVHEPLVDIETWDAAQAEIQKRSRLGGKARPTCRSLLASLIVCKRCGNPFGQIWDRRWEGPKGDGMRYYRCMGYHRYGKTVCGLVSINGYNLDEFVLGAIKQALLGDHETVKQAVDAFVDAVIKPKSADAKPKSNKRELDLLNRKIKSTVAMISDPAFDGIDELKTTLADLKSKRDKLQNASAKRTPAKREWTKAELRKWALEQFEQLDNVANSGDASLEERQLVEAFVQRIEVDPETKTGTVVLTADLETALNATSTREPRGDFMGAHEWAFYGWKEGAGHKFYGPNNATDLWHVKKIPPQQLEHLTGKPAELAVMAMQYSSRKGDNVLDLFGGSGSTLIGAEQTGRRAFLMELDPPYCDVIIDRYQRFTGNAAVLERTGESPIPVGARVENMR